MKKNNKIKGKKTRIMPVSPTTHKKLFLKNSLGNKRCKETNLTHIKIRRKNCVKGIPSLCIDAEQSQEVYL